MRLRTVLSIAALLAALAFITCNTKKLTNPSGSTLLPGTGTICDSCLSATVDWTPNITHAQALLMAKDYRRDTGKQYIYRNGRVTSEKDALSIRFDLKDMKNFIEAVEKNACNNNCNDWLGIRIYYGRYPIRDSMVRWGLNPDYAEHHTLFMVPTYYNSESEKHIDFIGNGGCRIAFDAGKTPYIFGLDGKNHGGIMPPPEGEGVFPTTIVP